MKNSNKTLIMFREGVFARQGEIVVGSDRRRWAFDGQRWFRADVDFDHPSQDDAPPPELRPRHTAMKPNRMRRGGKTW